MRHWTQEERERQSELIRAWKPWERSTGPVTAAGKQRVSKNALVHGGYSQTAKIMTDSISHFLRHCKDALSSTVER